MKKNRNTETIQMICLDLPCSVPTNGFSPKLSFWTWCYAPWKKRCVSYLFRSPKVDYGCFRNWQKFYSIHDKHSPRSQETKNIGFWQILSLHFACSSQTKKIKNSSWKAAIWIHTLFWGGLERARYKAMRERGTKWKTQAPLPPIAH